MLQFALSMDYLDIPSTLPVLRGAKVNGDVGIWAPNGGGREEERDAAVYVRVFMSVSV